MGNQRTFASVAWSAKDKVTRRERFLAEMDAVIPWARPLRLIEPHYPKAGWASIEEERTLPEYAFGILSIPHSWLFPRMSAVVHHGGAGTTGAGLRAGVPSIVTPFVADQPNWAKRIEALGVGPRAIPFRGLTAELLADAIRQATSDTAMRQRASDIGERIRSENGIETAIDLFETFVQQGA